MKNNKQRIFIGLDLSGYLMDTIPMIKSTIIDNKKLISWVSGRNLHLTLSFIGSIDIESLDKLKEALNNISTFKSFNMIINNTGSFPSFEKPRIIWLDIKEGRNELANIQNKIEKIASPFKENQKPENFVPHITIGRIKDFNKNINLDLSTFSNAVYSDIKIPVKTIYLFKSQLLDAGVEYSVISKYSLK